MTAKPRKPAEPFSAAFPDNLKESAQQIWLAGLGAFAKAQEQGGKVFEKLVKDGAELQRSTLPDATARMAGMASEFSARAAASGPWDRLENLFEQRVARAMENLGAPTAAEFAALVSRVAALEQAAPANPKAAKPKATKPKSAAKPRAPRKAT